MRREGIFTLLETAQFGTYAMSLDQRIVFWNRSAERILGHRAAAVLGRHCYDVVAGVAQESVAVACLSGCPSLRSLQEGAVPRAVKMQMLCAWGQRKTVSLTPMLVSSAGDDAPLLVHMFDDPEEAEAPGSMTGSVRGELSRGGADVVSDHPPTEPAPADNRALTARELEVLRLVALGRTTAQIANALQISQHTVRNHVRHLRGKLNAPTKLEAVLTALRQGLLEWDQGSKEPGDTDGGSGGRGPG